MGRGRDEQTKEVLSSSEMAGFVFIPASQSLLHKPPRNHVTNPTSSNRAQLLETRRDIDAATALLDNKR